MRLAVFSDLHVDAVTMGVARRPEAIAFLQTLEGAILREDEGGIDAVLFAGDWADPGHLLGPQYEADAVEWFSALAAATKRGELVAVSGNHDVLEVDRPLSTLAPALAAARRAREGVSVAVAQWPRVVPIQIEGCLAVLCLPYVSRAASAGEEYERALDDAFEEAGDLRSSGARLVVLSHLCVPGARIGSETREMARGREVDLPVERIAELRPDAVVNGHYHAPQEVRVSGMTVVVPGSPLSFTTDDPARGKGYLILEL